MKLQERERKVLLLGGIGVAIILAYAGVIRPLHTRWTQMGDELASKRAFVDELRGQVHDKDSLLARRDRLARRMGSLLGAAPAEDKKKDAEKAASEGAKAEGEPEAAKDVKPPTPEPPEARVSVTPEGGEEPESPVSGPEEAPDAAINEPEAESVSEGDSAAEASPGKEGAENAGDAPPAPETEKAAADGKQKGEEDDGPARREELDLAAYVERAAHSAGVRIKRVTPERDVGRAHRGGKYFEPVALRVNIEGSPDGVLKLLHALEWGDRFTRVEHFELRRDVERGDSVDTSMKVVGYVKKEVRS